MLKIYGDSNQLTECLKKILKLILDKSSSNNYEDYIYCGYPCVIEQGNKTKLDMLYVSRKGVFSLGINTNQKRINREYIFPKLYKISTVADKFDDGKKVFRLFDCEKDNVEELFTLEDILSDDEIRLFNAKFQNTESLGKKDDRECKPGSLGEMIKAKNNAINIYDKSQFEFIINLDMSKNLRIRGLAGSGKTIVMVKKMAYMHYINPNLDMAYVFFTVSLKQYIEKLFKECYQELNPDHEPNYEKVMFLHSWGNQKFTGFYSYICDKNNVEKEPYQVDIFSRNTYEEVCTRLSDSLSGKTIEPLFNYIFVDEAQDFSLPFFKLARKVLKAEGRIIYAYDELQSLNDSNKIPSPKEIFGNEECKDYNLETCYRTPLEILVPAHAIGMRIYSKENSMCNIPEDLSIWKAIGYKTDEPLEYGKNAVFYRTKSFIEYSYKNPIEFCISDEDFDQYDEVAKTIYNLITNESVKPEDILIIDMDSFFFEANFRNFKEKFVTYQNKRTHGGERKAATHIVNKDQTYNVKLDGSIPYTTIFRAKGNEADIVFILNSNTMEHLQTYSRNRLFTAMTRAKFKVYIYGTEFANSLKKEYERVVENGFRLIFKYPSITELEKMKTFAKTEKKDANDYSKAVEVGSDLAKKDREAYLNLLMKQTGCNSQEELLTFLKKTENE